MRMRSVAVILALGVFGCSSVRPVAVKTGDICHRCQRTIENPKLAAQLVDANGHARTFRTAGCLATFLKANPAEKATIFVTDYTTGELFPVSGALFVRVKLTDGDKVERDFLAFRTIADAQGTAEKEMSKVVDWAAVRSHIAAAKS